MTRVAALYVDPRGPYPRMRDVDAWDRSRDARSYDGPHPVVAHPPCGPWGKLSHLYKGGDVDCAPIAVAQVRKFGGVLEHPRDSALWRYAGLPEPGAPPDEYGGRSIEVHQVDWGHVARKATWLYLVGVPHEALRFLGLRPRREPTHWASGSRTAPRGPVPPGIKVCSAQQRNRTPQAFAEWLVELARATRR